LARRRHALGKRRRRRADEPAAREHVERTSPFTDEVRRRLEARCPVHSAARQQRHVRLAQEPRRRLRRVTRIGIFRQRTDETARPFRTGSHPPPPPSPGRTPPYGEARDTGVTGMRRLSAFWRGWSDRAVSAAAS